MTSVIDISSCLEQKQNQLNFKIIEILILKEKKRLKISKKLINE